MTHYIGPVTAELKDWKITDWMGYNIALGLIHGDTKNRWPDGRYIHTSSIKKIEERLDCFIIITRNSVYRLWKCDKAETSDGDARSSG